MRLPPTNFKALRAGSTEVRPAKVNPSAAGRLRRFRIKSVAADHVVCRSWDGTTEGTTDIKVAKEWWLRRTPFDGQSFAGHSYVYSSDVERIADGNETQVLVPPYATNAELNAAPRPTGGTGVTGAPDWLEVSARFWAKKAGT